MQFLNRGEIPVVRYLPASDPPDSLGRVEFGGVRRQEYSLHSSPVLVEELFQILRFMPGSIVHNEVHFPFGVLNQVADKIAKGLAVESRRLLGQQVPRFGIDCPEETDFLTCGGRDYVGLFSPASPHSCQSAMPLEMNFVLAPELNFGIFHPLTEVFLNASWRSRSASCALRRGLWRVKPSW